jgi:endoglucanase
MLGVKKNYLLLVVLASFFVASSTWSASDILTVSGNKFLLNGQPIILRGVAMGDPHDRIVNYGRVSSEDYKTIKNDWQANVVRLSVHPGVFINDWVRGKKILEDEVAAARRAGLFVIIDWHVIGEPDGWYKPNTTDKKQYYTYTSDFSIARDFWRYAAKEFSGDRGIIFEIWNEPVNQNNDLSWNNLRPYLAQLVGVVRGNSSDNIILAPGVNWDYDLRGIKENPLAGVNIAYSWHVYNNNGSLLSRETALGGLNQNYPVFITEWGSVNVNDFGYTMNNGLPVYKYLEAMKNMIVKQDLSFTAWCWHPSWDPEMFLPGWQELNNYGILVKDFLNFPEQVSARLAADEATKERLENEARLAEDRRLAESRLAEERKLAEEKARQAVINYDAKSMKEREFKLRIEAFINYGADALSAKFSKNERQTILNNFIFAFGHEPSNENEWVDLMLVVNGDWPYRSSALAEGKAQKNFALIFRRAPNLNIRSDRQAVKILAYGLRPRIENRNINKEKSAIASFIYKFRRLPKNETDWNFIRVLAYSGVKK